MSENSGIRSNTQEWFRNYTHDLASSFRSLALIQHNLTKGEARENQFVVALETKSALDGEEIADIITKSRSLPELIGQPGRLPYPKTAAFVYSCTNPNLRFLDYATSAHVNGFHSPNAICVLGSAVMGLARQQDNKITFTEDWDSDSFPAFVRCGDDALLLLFYLLSKWAIIDPAASSGFARYVKGAFSDVSAFHFDGDFLDSLAASPPRLESVRELFKRRGTSEIEVLYEEARRSTSETA